MRDLDGEVRDQIDSICERFEVQWKSDQPPQIEDYLSEIDSHYQSQLLAELFHIERWHRQKKNSTLTLEQWKSRFPQYADDLEHWLNEESVSSVSKRTVIDGGIRVRCPHCHQPIEILEHEALNEVTCSSCGSSFNLLSDSTTIGHKKAGGETIAHFELLRKLGTGAFGTVWKARDQTLDRIVALKVPRHNQLSIDDREKFFREARAAAQLKHDNIVSVHEVGRDGDTVFIVSEFIDGITLTDWLTGQQPTSQEAAELCETIAQALHHAHQSGVIHRDVKPGNIMLDKALKPFVMDFGLAKRETGEITVTAEGAILGTPAYMSPEQAQGEAHDVDARSDVYSLGVVLFEMLTGERPFRGNVRMLINQVVHDEAPSPRKLNGTIPRDLETICLKCLQKDSVKRYSSAEELAADLQRFLEQKPIKARPTTMIGKAWKWSLRNPTVAAMSLVSLFLLLSLAIGGPIVAIQQLRLNEALISQRADVLKSRMELLKQREQMEILNPDFKEVKVEREASEEKPTMVNREDKGIFFSQLSGVELQIEEICGIDLVERSSVTFHVTGSKIHVNSGCHLCAFEYSSKSNGEISILTKHPMCTANACEDRLLLDQQSVVHYAFQLVAHYHWIGEEIVLLDGNRTVVMRLKRLALFGAD